MPFRRRGGQRRSVFSRAASVHSWRWSGGKSNQDEFEQLARPPPKPRDKGLGQWDHAQLRGQIVQCRGRERKTFRVGNPLRNNNLERFPTFVEDVAILATGPEHDERSRRNLQPTEDLWGETNDVYQRIRIDRRPVGNQSVQAKPCDLDVSQVEKAEANANGAGAQLGGFRVPAREQVAETIDVVEFKQFEVRSHGMVTQQKPLRSTYQAQLSMDKAPDNIL